MNRVFKIVGYIFVLFVVYIGSTTVLESCKGATKGETVVEEGDDYAYNSDEEIYDEYFESDDTGPNDDAQESDAIAASSESEYENPVTDNSDDYDEDFSFEANEEEKKQINSNKPVRTVQARPQSASGGNFLVVAGSYLIRDNAEKMVKKLKGMGYSDAEIVNFDESKYHSISAGRFSSYDGAGDVAANLKNKGIDCYVHTRK